MTPNRIAAEVEFFSDRALCAHDEVQERVESRVELKAQIARERLVAKLNAIKPIDLIAGLHSAHESQHGDALRAAWFGSVEQFGALVKAIIVDALEAEADLEAEEALIRIEGAAREEVAKPHRTFVIAGY